jgi:hypothetical protein
MQVDNAADCPWKAMGIQPGTDLIMGAGIIALAIVIDDDVLPPRAIAFDLEQVFAFGFTRVFDDRRIRVGL